MKSIKVVVELGCRCSCGQTDGRRSYTICVCVRIPYGLTGHSRQRKMEKSEGEESPTELTFQIYFQIKVFQSHELLIFFLHFNE
ncbi:uncharacterized [Tachysurus ichikawai]